MSCKLKNRANLLKYSFFTVFTIQWNFSFGTSLFRGHSHSRDTKFGLGKMPTGIIFVSITFIEGIPIKGKEQIVLKPGFNLHSEDSVMALKK